MKKDLTTFPGITPLQRLTGRLAMATCLLLAVFLAGAGAARLPDRSPSALPLGSQPLVELMYEAETQAPGLTNLQDEPVEAALIPTLQPRTRTLLMEVTAYCPCTRCCGPNAQGITASGRRVDYNGGKFVAADTSILPFGTRVSIPGYHDGEIVEVIDRGGAIKGNKLDVYFDCHQVARQWGRQWLIVTIHEEPTLASVR